MTKTSKLVLIGVVAAGFTSSVLAQSRDSGRKAFGMVPSNSTFADPALTGGGSVGYNAELPQHTD